MCVFTIKQYYADYYKYKYTIAFVHWIPFTHTIWLLDNNRDPNTTNATQSKGVDTHKSIFILLPLALLMFCILQNLTYLYLCIYSWSNKMNYYFWVGKCVVLTQTPFSYTKQAYIYIYIEKSFDGCTLVSKVKIRMIIKSQPSSSSAPSSS